MTAIAVVAICVDQFSKSWARQELVNGHVIELVAGVQFRLAYNRGIAFGLGDGLAPILVTFAIAALVVVLLGRHIELNKVSILGVGLVLGGALGNLADRLFRDTNGAVVDFIELPRWPIFNVADSCIVVGALVLAISASRRKVEPT